MTATDASALTGTKVLEVTDLVKEFPVGGRFLRRSMSDGCSTSAR